MSFTLKVCLAGGLLLAAGGVGPLCGGGSQEGASAAAAQALTPQSADTATARFAVSGMTCGSCATTARLALQRVPGVYGATVSYDSASAVVRYDPRRVSPRRIAQHLERMTGYSATPVSAGDSPGRGRAGR